MKKIILISGPTASGKSKLALNIAKKIKGEIINADSMQVYKEFSVLSSRPSKLDTKRVKHYLYGDLFFSKKYFAVYIIIEMIFTVQCKLQNIFNLF